MTARRFYVEDASVDDRVVEIGGAEFRHLNRVLRLGPGAAVTVFNGRGVELSGVVESVGGEAAVVAVTGATEGSGESPVEITLLQGIVKGVKPELIVQKSVELGLARVVFYPASRSVAGLAGGARGARKLERLERVAVEAAKQCERSVVPQVSFAPDLAGALDLAAGAEVKLVFLERHGLEKEGPARNGKTLADTLAASRGTAAVAALIGPEGGFTEEEAGVAVGRGFRPVSLGPRVLRAETAAIAAVTIIQYELGDAGGRGARGPGTR